LRDQLKVAASARELLEGLDPYKIERSTRWPGTELLKGAGEATLHHFTLDERALAVLAGATDAINEWIQPERPEDLCALRPDNTAWLASIAHESDAWLELTADERQQVLARLPGLHKQPSQS